MKNFWVLSLKGAFLFLGVAVSVKAMASPSCPNPRNWTSLSKRDKAMLKGVHEGCQRRFGPDSCAVRVEVRGELNYHVICRNK